MRDWMSPLTRQLGANPFNCERDGWPLKPLPRAREETKVDSFHSGCVLKHQVYQQLHVLIYINSFGNSKILNL